MTETPRQSPNPFERPLSKRESWLVGMEISGLAQARLPLASGLRVSAAETSSRRLAWALDRLAGDLERGVPLDEALERSSLRLPPYFLALVVAGLRTGSLGRVLQDFAEQRRRSDDQWRSIRRTLAYPIVILALAVTLFLCVVLWIVPQVAGVVTEFGVELPRSTRLMFWLSQEGLAWMAIVVLGIAVSILLLRLLSGPWFLHAILSGVPIVGMMWRLGNWSELSHLMALLLEHGVPLPDALRLTSEAVRDERLARATRVLAERCEQGGNVVGGLSGLYAMPATLRPVLGWGEQKSALPDAFRAAAEMFSARLELHAQLVRVVSAPVTFLIVVAFVLFTATAMFLPFIKLITALT
jgi:general secretion pathway protein F